MSTINKLKQIGLVEKIDFSHLDERGVAVNWLFLSSILNQKRMEKYSLWFVTGMIAPEAGQISPAIAHSGHMTTRLSF